MEKLHGGISINTASNADGNSCKNFYRLSRTHTHTDNHLVSVVLHQLDASQFAYCQLTGGKQQIEREREGGEGSVELFGQVLLYCWRLLTLLLQLASWLAGQPMQMFGPRNVAYD